MDKGVIMQMNMNEVLKTAREWIAAAALSNLAHQDTCLSSIRRVLSTLSIQPKMDTRFFSKHKRSRQCEFYTDFKQLCYIQIDQLIRSLSLVIGRWHNSKQKVFKLGGEIWVHTYLHTMLSRPKKLYQTQNWYGTEDLNLSKDLILAI